MDNLLSEIKAVNQELFNKIVEYRRHIHQNPELSFQEFETAKYIRNILHENGITTDDSFGENAVIAIFGEGGETVALRADIDALPICEEVDLPFRSQNEGVMHACGHDAHAASLLGTALILKRLQKYIHNRIILIFQPGEELCPGGANILVQKGLLEKYSIKRIVGMHVSAELPTGKFLFGSGYLMAATNELYIKFHGVGGHAAMPQKRSDTVLALADFLVEVRKMQESLTDDMPFVVAFGKIVGDGALNVVPPETSAEGTMRTFNPVLHKTIEENLKRISQQSAAKYKCTAELEVRKGYPAVYNNPEVTAKARRLAADYVSEANIDEMPLKMTAEDFAYYSEKIPATFFRAGIMGNGRGEVTQHNPKFDMDEEVFHETAGLMAYIALNLNDRL
ncbi:MAG: amidohydrolase [Bacteroidales bacterium]|nr:amidohydrolase [Bacteroidales bacterium]